ncbi:MAG TPA: cation diffusion facilitator family transporter [Anaeromyxobacteraceae bacterium]|nr:cation diffusion facilitator family transporter [Anaeromyxobacteraceae bacterium]
MTIQTAEIAAAAEAARREKHLVAFGSLSAALLLTALKLVVGFSSGSIGILSEAAHSSLDLVAAFVTLWAIRASSKPADRDHPYGHGKIENFSALFETGLLLATCAFIAYEAVERLAYRTVLVRVTPWAFGLMALSMVVDLSRSRALRRAASKHRSQALAADALHFATDVWSSAVVLLGLVGVWLAGRLEKPWLSKADAVAALGVAAIAVVVSLRLGKKSVDDLLDAAPAGLLERVARAAAVPGVASVSQVRVRQSGPDTFADVVLQVPRALSLAAAHDLADVAEEAIRRAVAGVDVVVHAEPAPEAEGASAIDPRRAESEAPPGTLRSAKERPGPRRPLPRPKGAGHSAE